MMNILRDVLAILVRMIQSFLGQSSYPTLSVNAEDAVLVILDPLETYRYTFKDLRPLRRLMAEAKSRGVPIVRTRWVRTRGSVDDIVNAKGHWTEFVSSDREPFLEDLEEGDADLSVAFADAFAPLPRELRESAEDGKEITSLQDLMEERGASVLVLAGTWAEACVERTAYSACTKGYVPIVVRPAVGGHWVDPTLARMDMVYASVVEDVVFLQDTESE